MAAILSPGAIGKLYTSGLLVIPGATSTVSVAHNLGGVPKTVELSLVCVSADAGYSVGDEVNMSDVPVVVNVAQFTVMRSSTSLKVVINAVSGIYVNHFSTYATTAITVSSWKLKLKAAL